MANNFYDDCYYQIKADSLKVSQVGSKIKEREIEFFNKIFQPKSGKVLLDLGCGTGDYLGSLKKRTLMLGG